MGKLHTLKRAILRSPEKWHKGGYVKKSFPADARFGFEGFETVVKTKVLFYGARFKNGQWEPYGYSTHSGKSVRYAAFVRSVLIEHALVGNADSGAG